MTKHNGFKIEKGVKVPKIARSGRPLKYPFDVMKVGDSFVCRADDPTMRSAAMQYGKRHSKQFITRATDDGLRCWRTA